MAIRVETVFAAFEAAARAHDAKPFLCDPATWQDLSYGAALERVVGISRRYRAEGCGAGHRVALRMPSGPGMLLNFLALNSLGASVVPLNPDSTQAELDYITDHSEAGRGDVGATECALLYTSGTTGKPKGCLLSNAYFLDMGRRYLQEGGLCALRQGEERLITPLPLSHMNALAYSSTAMTLSAGCVIQLDRFHPRSWWESVALSRASIVHYLGVMPALLLNLPESSFEKSHRVRFGFGANVNPRTMPRSRRVSAFR